MRWPRILKDLRGYFRGLIMKIIKGIKRASIEIPETPYFAEDREDLIKMLNKDYHLDIKKLLGIYVDEKDHSRCYIFYK